MDLSMLKSKRGLSIVTNATGTSSKKYLGESDDLHFIPKSPLISRQFLTSYQEDELRRACTRVLSGVQHSDDLGAVDALKSNATTTIPEVTKAQFHYKDGEYCQRQTTSGSNESWKAQSYRYNANETATPSLMSKRDTIDRVSMSTPGTSAGITPSETGKRFSDGLRRPSTQTRSSQFRSESKQSQYQPFTFLHEGATDACTKTAPAAAQSMTHLPTLSMRTRASAVDMSKSKQPTFGVMDPEVNKSLPSIPHIDASWMLQKKASMSQLLKGKDRKFTTVEHAEVAAPRTVRSRPTHVESAMPKAKFSFATLFGKKRRQHSQPVMMV